MKLFMENILRMCKQCVPGLSSGGRGLGTRLTKNVHIILSIHVNSWQFCRCIISSATEMLLKLCKQQASLKNS